MAIFDIMELEAMEKEKCNILNDSFQIFNSWLLSIAYHKNLYEKIGQKLQYYQNTMFDLSKIFDLS